MKFRNLRRPARAVKAGLEVPPPAKRKKCDVFVLPDTPSCSDAVEYEQHVSYIQRSFASQKWSLSSLSQLLQETAKERRRWIVEDLPTVAEVLLKFPCLTEPKLVSFRKCTCTMYSE